MNNMQAAVTVSKWYIDENGFKLLNTEVAEDSLWLSIDNNSDVIVTIPGEGLSMKINRSELIVALMLSME